MNLTITVSMDDWFALEQKVRNQKQAIEELREALFHAEQENLALRIRLDTMECAEQRQNEDHYPYDLRQRVVELEKDLERVKDRMAGRL